MVANILSNLARGPYQNVLSWARTSANAKDFLERISTPGLSNPDMRQFKDIIQDKLDKCCSGSVSDEDLWNFFRSLVVLELDLRQTDSKDKNTIITLLQNVLPPEARDRTTGLFDKLAAYSAEAHSTAGSFNLSILAQKLQADGFILSPPADTRADLERLRNHATYILNEIRTDIGGLQINRDKIIAQAFEAMNQASLLELVGPPGVGKSAILKALAEPAYAYGPAVVLAGDRIQGNGWDGFAQHLQLTQPLDKLLLAISANLTPCIFIDGIDRVSDSGARKAVNDLLNCVKELADKQSGAIKWKVVVSARAENLNEVHGWLNWQALGKPQLQEVPELTDAEVNLIAEHRSHLQGLIKFDKQVMPAMRNLFMLSLIERRRENDFAKDMPAAATEIWISDIWWERLVGFGQSGEGRQQVLLKLGEQAASRPSAGLSGTMEDPLILQSLQSDRILVRDGSRLIYHFEHDLIEDWVLWRVLDQHREELAAYLLRIGQPFGLYRALQLMALSLLENNPTPDSWSRLLRQIEEADQLMPRWRQAVLSSPLISPLAPELLKKIEPLLLADEGRLLGDLMVTLRTVEVYPDFSLLPAAAMVEKDINAILSLLFYSPVPRWQTWQPLMAWLLDRLETLPSVIRPEMVRLMEAWQTKAPPNSIFRAEISRQALSWLLKMEHWRVNDED